MLQPSDHLPGPLNSLLKVPVLTLKASELDAALQEGSHKSGEEGIITLNLLITLLLMQSRMQPAFWAVCILVEFREVCKVSLLKSVKAPLDGIPSLQCIDSTTQFSVVSKLSDGALDPIVHVTDKDLK
ncbi:hypothetical protein BTVI_53934 [Pitangus sulphuratus]|nr:hypothetical protein BTVI_53934 [Pitangus sulphuratus]